MTTDTGASPVTLISLDIEAAGPSPSDYAMLSLGACLVDALAPGLEARAEFYVELQPDREGEHDTAMSVGGFTLDALRKTGTPAAQAMADFVAWVESVTPAGSRPVMVGFNAPFDWMFVADYCHRYLGHNPLGHSAIDVKAFYAGVTGEPWQRTSMPHVADRYALDITLTHNALDDARDQAALFRAVRAEREAQ